MSEYRRIGKTNRYIVEKEPIVWDIGFKGNENKEVVPVGFQFDVSIPWLLTWAFSRHDPRFFKAAALHDYLLEMGYDRVSAAGAFNHGLKSLHVPYWTRFVMTISVAIYTFE